MSDDDGPDMPTTPGAREPSADLRLMASTLHQMFTALLLEGFTESQALRIIGSILAAKPDGPAS